ncbi:MAG: acetyl-CoA synthetase, partial [Gaiellales bacterium]|nr:acetyl-CoA synthetase [Gaiellales bacterium]
MQNELIWQPSPEVVQHARVTAFMRDEGIADWRTLHTRAQEDIDWFWDAVVRHLGIEFFTPYERVSDQSAGPEWTRWFTGGTVNLTHNCVDRHARATPGHPAVICEREDGEVVTATYADLELLTNRIANALLALGVRKGDAVGLFLPMSVEVVAAFYAVCKIGAIVVPIFSGFAAPAVAARLADAGAVCVICADAVPRRGRPVSMKATVDEALADAPTVRHAIVWERMGSDTPMTAGRDHRFADLVERQSGRLKAPALDPETPMMVIYTSGTSGRPKGAVHVHGGFLVKIAEECAFQTDVHADDRFTWMSDMGWIMGPKIVVGAGALGATLVLSEGAPDYPGPDRMWQLVERHRITVLGVSPTLIRALRPHGDEPVLSHDRSSLRILASTGEPWNPDPYRWLFEVAGEGRCPIINLSGGT